MPSQPHRAGRSLRTALTLSVMVAALSGCAGQMAFRDGRNLIAQDQVEAGLLKLQQAIASEPGNAEYRATYLQARDRASTRYIEQAERQMEQGQNALAMDSLRRVLAMDPQNERARAGYRTLEMNERHAKLLAAATELVAKKDFDLAKTRVNAILTEKPDHADARALLREINEKAPPVQNDGALGKAYKQPITIEFPRRAAQAGVRSDFAPLRPELRVRQGRQDRCAHLDLPEEQHRGSGRVLPADVATSSNSRSWTATRCWSIRTWRPS
jgi:general secretion pathway protein D